MAHGKIKKTIRILVADDHLIVRHGIVSLLSLNSTMEVIGEAGDGQTVVDLSFQQEPDVILMDVNMPGKDGLQATREILLHLPKTKILVLSGYDTKEYVKKILESGAHGYLLKTTSPDELYAAIEAVYSGEAFFSPHISKILLDDYIGNLQRGSHEHISVYHGPLTRRECEILRLIALGNSHAVIADLLHLSIRTVDTHRNNIMKKLDLHDTASLVTYAIREGIAEFPL